MSAETRWDRLFQQDGDPPEMNVDEPIRDWTDSEYLVVNNFADLAARRIEAKHKLDRIEKEVMTLNLELAAMLKTADAKTVRFGQHRLTVGHSTTGGKLDRTKLLDQGVTAEQLARATTPKKQGRAYITVTQLKGPED